MRLGLEFVSERPSVGDDPWLGAQVEWSAILSTLRVEIVVPGGNKHTLQLAEPPPGSRVQPIAHLFNILFVDGAGLGKHRWKSAPPDLLAQPGKYSVALQGTATTNKGSFEFAIAPLSFEVVAAGASHRPIEELERIVAERLAKRRSLSAPPKSSSPTIDDVDGNRWLRFTEQPNPGYHVTVTELLVDPSGKELFVDEYRHFTCVAEGTSIATLRGELLIEALRVGDELISYDPEQRRLTTTQVKWIERSHARQLHVLGRLRVTGEHPIFVDGRFVAAREVASGAKLLDTDLRFVALEPRTVTETATVYDLGVGVPHTYFAGGVLVHNKSVPVPLGDVRSFRGTFSRRAARAP